MIVCSCDACGDIHTLWTELTLVDGRRGWAYTWAADIGSLPEDWSAEEFAARHLTGYVARCTRWRRHHESAAGGE